MINQPQLDMETKSDDKAVGTMLPTHLAVEEMMCCHLGGGAILSRTVHNTIWIDAGDNVRIPAHFRFCSSLRC